MDALTAAAFDSLAKDVLPRLTAAASALAALPPEKRVADDELQFLLYEARELLGLMLKWAGARDPGMSDVEALALMLAAETTPNKPDKDLVFEAGHACFSVPAARVQECIHLPQPRDGRIVHRGTEIPVIYPDATPDSLRPTWLKRIEGADPQRRLLLERDGGESSIGVIVQTLVGPFALAADRLFL